MTFYYFLISTFPLVGSMHSVLRFSYLRLLQWYRCHCPPSCKHQSPSSAWSSGHTGVPTVMCGPWTSCSCSPCCLAPTRMSLSSPSTWAVAPTSLPTGVTQLKNWVSQCFYVEISPFLVKLTKLGCNKGDLHRPSETP